MSRRNFITRACACILASTLLACTIPVHAQDLTNAAATYPSIPQMTLEEYPVVDGSLACILKYIRHSLHCNGVRVAVGHFFAYSIHRE